ncbi:MAG: TRAP transporter substrate-binding protein [Proteobacteria bacterium]|nr:TRAP transporter substrate-binding protein [Pseudomonadota bacterium]
MLSKFTKTIIALLFMLGSTSLVFAETTIRIASVSGPSHHHNEALNWFADKINKQKIGLNIKVLSGGQLGKSEREYIEGMQQGTIQMAQVSTGPMAGFIGEYDIFSLPYMFRDTEHFEKVLSGPVGAKFLGMLDSKDMKGLAWFDNGYRNMFNAKKPITKPSDMDGLKIRVMKSPLMVNTVNAMGGSATPMAYGELYSALKQGVLDGGENAAGNVLNDKFFEVSKYYSITQHFRPPGVVVMSKKTWNTLSTSQQKAITKAAVELQTYEIKLTTQVVGQALKDLEAKGMKINKVDVPAFAAAVKPVYKSYSDKYGSDMINAILNTK